MDADKKLPRSFRVDAMVQEGISISLSGSFEDNATLADMDAQVDLFVKVADRQRAVNELKAFTHKAEAEMAVLDQERERAAKIHAAVDGQKGNGNGSVKDADNAALTACQQNIQRLETSLAAGKAAIEGLKPRLRLE